MGEVWVNAPGRAQVLPGIRCFQKQVAWPLAETRTNASAAVG